MSTGAAKVSLILELKNKIHGGFQKAKQYVNENVRDLKSRISSLKESSISAFKEMTSSVPGLGSAIGLVKNPVVLLTTAMMALGAVGTKAFAWSSDWRHSMAQVNTTTQLSSEGLDKLSGKIRNIAANNVTDFARVPAAFEKLVSSGMDTNVALKALDPTLKAAKAGFADVELVASALAGVMNSSGMSDANKVFDILFAAKGAGNVELKDMASYLPKILPAANQAGIGLEQVAGAYAFLTKQGKSAEQSATLLENAFKTLASPDKAIAFQKIGVQFYDAKGHILPLVNIVGQLDKVLSGLSDKDKSTVLGSLGLDMEAASAFSSMTQDVKGLREIIDHATNSQGEMNKQYEAAREPMDSWKELANKVQIGLMDMVGDPILNGLGALGDFILENKTAFEILGYTLAGVGIAWGSYLAITGAATLATGAMTAAQSALNFVMNMNPIARIVTIVGVLIGAFITAYQKSETFRAAISGIIAVAKLLTDVFIGMGKAIIGAFTLDKDMFVSGIKQSAAAASSIMDGGISKAYDNAYNESIAKSRAASGEKLKPGAGVSAVMQAVKERRNETKNKNFKLPNDKSKKDKEGSSSIKGAEQVRNITTNIGNVINGDFVTKNQQFSNMSPQDFQRFLVDIITRYTRGMELSTN